MAVFRDPLYFITFGFGSGLIPKAPGTFGTLVAVPIYLLLIKLPVIYYLAVVLLFLGFGIWACEKVSQDLGEHDYPGIVWDEVVGYLLTMTGSPPGLLWIVLGFFLFRLFDIWKPGLIRLVDKKIKGGLGIMIDDVLAALPAWLILQCLIWGLGT
jgi:phosphatidylglycerophosphatase A